MAKPRRDEVNVFLCVVCHGEDGRDELVEEVFKVDGQYVLVGGVQAVHGMRALRRPLLQPGNY